MKKVPLRFINNQIEAKVIIDAEAYRIRYKPITFIVDTGSSRSFISERDAMQLKLPIDILTNPESIRMGGSKYDLLQTKKMKLMLKTEENTTQEIVMPQFAITRATKKTEEARRESQCLPSILGTDFFTINSLLLHFDPRDNDSYVAKKE